MANESAYSEREFEHYIKASSTELNAQFEAVLAALDRLENSDAETVDPADLECIRQAAIAIGRMVRLDQRVQHHV